MAPYIFRVAIGNRRIIHAANGKVTFRYRASDTGQLRTCTLTDTHQAVGHGYTQLLPSSIQLVESIWLMGDRQPGYNGAGCIHESDIMFILAPVNTDTDTYGNLLEFVTGCPGPAQAAVHLLEHSQCSTLLTVWPGKPGGTIPTWRSQRGSNLGLDPQVTGGRGRQAVDGNIACSTPFLIRSPLV